MKKVLVNQSGIVLLPEVSDEAKKQSLEFLAKFRIIEAPDDAEEGDEYLNGVLRKKDVLLIERQALQDSINQVVQAGIDADNQTIPEIPADAQYTYTSPYAAWHILESNTPYPYWLLTAMAYERAKWEDECFYFRNSMDDQWLLGDVGSVLVLSFETDKMDCVAVSDFIDFYPRIK